MENLDQKIKETLEKGLKVGCVYPASEDRTSFYIHSNLKNSVRIECADGFFYAEDIK